MDDIASRSSLAWELQEELERTCGENASKKGQILSGKSRAVAIIEAEVSSWRIQAKVGPVMDLATRRRKRIWHTLYYEQYLLENALKIEDHVVLNLAGIRIGANIRLHSLSDDNSDDGHRLA